MHLKSVTTELCWFLRGESNIKFLQDHGVTIWDEWADQNGDLGPVYGTQWRRFGERYDEVGNDDVILRPGTDQIEILIDGICKDPLGRRHIVSAWNPAEIPKCALPPCHVLFQVKVVDTPRKQSMSLVMYQRSLDLFLGAPFNIASYSILLHMISEEVFRRTGKRYLPGNFVHMIGDAHIYLNHVDQLSEQNKRESIFCDLSVNLKNFDMNDPKIEDIKIEGYDSHPAIKGEVAV